MPERLDRALVLRGLVRSRERARALVEQGLVRVGGVVVARPAEPVPDDAVIELIEDDHPYVSRGAFKLLAALDAFELSVDDKICLDAGASTGGFTDVLLRRGARRVYAVDVGRDQLDPSLRADPRVRSREGVNLRDPPPDLIPEPLDLAVADVSFISLTLILPGLVRLMDPPAGQPLVCLVKPQFEAGPAALDKHGVVRDERDRQAALARVQQAAAALGLEVGPHLESPLPGPEGNREWLLLLRHAQQLPGPLVGPELQR